MSSPFLVIVMGVSGSGKTTLAKALAESLGFEYMEADDFHSPQAKRHMASGLPLTDSWREPWIAAMCQHVRRLSQKKRNCVLAYSGLRRAHRQQFRELKMQTLFLNLTGDVEILKQRLVQRQDHFMPAGLLSSQLKAMDPPKSEHDIVSVDLSLSPSQQSLQAMSLIQNQLIKSNTGNQP